MSARSQTTVHGPTGAAHPVRGHGPRCPSRTAVRILIGGLLVAALLAAPAPAALDIDFEQPYYHHPGQQVWDSSLVHDGEQFHLFYHAIPLDQPIPAAADHIWRTSTVDLIHWSEPQVVLSISDAAFEREAVWAPDVVHDPDTGRWWMAYTGVDTLMNQRIGMAWSSDLVTWQKIAGNPVVEPDPAVFAYDTASGWADCRDPFLHRDEAGWHLLTTNRVNGEIPWQGAVGHATSADLEHWSPLDVLLVNDGGDPTNILESPGYIVREGTHHLFFHEQDIHGIKHMSTTDPGSWTFANAAWIALGIAPAVTSVDGGQTHHIVRIGHFQDAAQAGVAFVAHVDTLEFLPGDPHPQPQGRQPLSKWFAAWNGQGTAAAPTYGDNQLRRGLPPVGLEGTGYYSSAEFFQGPLGGGIPGHTVGDVATAWLFTPSFTISEPWITMLAGGTQDPEHCYVALFDAASDSLLRRESGEDQTSLTRRWWDVSDLIGREVYLRIEDSSPSGQIMVDDIRETATGSTTGVVAGPGETAGPGDPGHATGLTDRGAGPNPANPGTTLRCELARPAPLRVRIFDLRGREIWDSGLHAGVAGINRITWQGQRGDGRLAPGGVYLYRWEVSGRPAPGGKLTLAP